MSHNGNGNGKAKAVLLVSPNRELARVLQCLAGPIGLRVRRAPSAYAAMACIAREQYAGIIAEFDLPDVNGCSLLLEVQRRRGFPGALPDCFLLAPSDEKAAGAGQRLCPANVVTRPSVTELAGALRHVASGSTGGQTERSERPQQNRAKPRLQTMIASIN